MAAAAPARRETDWKIKATVHLLHVFVTSMRRSNPEIDLRPHIPVLRQIITISLAGVEDRFRRYAEHLKHPSSQKRLAEEAQVILDIERNIQQMVDQQLAAARRQAEQSAAPPARHQSGA